jgi:hypothetical protein
MGRSPVHGILYIIGFPGLKPYTRGPFILGDKGGGGVRIYFE